MAAALLACWLYACFAHGAVPLGDGATLEVALAAVGIAGVARSGLRARAPAIAWGGVALLSGFALWCALSLLWSVAPDASWAEANRALLYALAAALAIAAARARRPVERAAAGWLAVATAVALYAGAHRVVPGLFDRSVNLPRLRAPLDYWNALGLVCVLGLPVALRFATDETLRTRARLLTLVCATTLVAVLGMTYSRGGIVALVVAAAVTTALGGPRLRGLAALALAIAAAAPVLAVVYGGGASGGAIGGAYAGGLLALLGAGWLAARAERGARRSPARERRAWLALAAVAVLATAGGAGALAASQRGLGGSFAHAWHTFSRPQQDRQLDPVRLLSTTSANRWVWWKEAAGAFSDRPLKGWGAGSFPVTHKLYRTDTLAVAQPHSVPLQFLAETGIAGFALAIGGLALLFAAALRTVLALPAGRERDLAGALLAAAAAWAVHTLYDWDWDIPAVTLPAMVALGLLAGRAPARAAAPFAALAPRPPAGGFAGAAATVLALGAFAASAVLPAWADAKASGAAASAGSTDDPAALQRAAAQADLAARLDPLATRPLFVAAAVAEHRGRLGEARSDLLEAVDRDPYSEDAWFRLAQLSLVLADRSGFQYAARRVLALDPMGPGARGLAARAVAVPTPPDASATATGTPLPAG